MKKASILLTSGNYFFFDDPDGSRFTIDDIATSLSRLCRFNGHGKSFYSVAQHSILVSEIVPQELAMQGLFHDAVEAFIGDMTKPLKNLFPGFKELETRIEKSIFPRLGLPEELDPRVKMADLVALATEQRDIKKNLDCWTSTEGAKPLDRRIGPYSIPDSYYWFCKRFCELTNSEKTFELMDSDILNTVL